MAADDTTASSLIKRIDQLLTRVKPVSEEVVQCKAPRAGNLHCSAVRVADGGVGKEERMQERLMGGGFCVVKVGGRGAARDQRFPAYNFNQLDVTRLSRG